MQPGAARLIEVLDRLGKSLLGTTTRDSCEKDADVMIVHANIPSDVLQLADHILDIKRADPGPTKFDAPRGLSVKPVSKQAVLKIVGGGA